MAIPITLFSKCCFQQASINCSSEERESVLILCRYPLLPEISVKALSIDTSMCKLQLIVPLSLNGGADQGGRRTYDFAGTLRSSYLYG